MARVSSEARKTLPVSSSHDADASEQMNAAIQKAKAAEKIKTDGSASEGKNGAGGTLLADASWDKVQDGDQVSVPKLNIEAEEQVDGVRYVAGRNGSNQYETYAISADGKHIAQTYEPQAKTAIEALANAKADVASGKAIWNRLGASVERTEPANGNNTAGTIHPTFEDGKIVEVRKASESALPEAVTPEQQVWAENAFVTLKNIELEANQANLTAQKERLARVTNGEGIAFLAKDIDFVTVAGGSSTKRTTRAELIEDAISKGFRVVGDYDGSDSNAMLDYIVLPQTEDGGQAAYQYAKRMGVNLDVLIGPQTPLPAFLNGAKKAYDADVALGNIANVQHAIGILGAFAGLANPPKYTPNISAGTPPIVTSGMPSISQGQEKAPIQLMYNPATGAYERPRNGLTLPGIGMPITQTQLNKPGQIIGQVSGAQTPPNAATGLTTPSVITPNGNATASSRLGDLDELKRIGEATWEKSVAEMLNKPGVYNIEPISSGRSSEFEEQLREVTFNRYRDFGFQKEFPVTSELFRLYDVKETDVLNAMQNGNLTSAESLVQMGVVDSPPPPSGDPYVNRFVTHPTAYRTNSRYNDYTNALAPFVENLINRGVRSENVAKFIAEQRRQYEAITNPLGVREFEFNTMFNSTSVNPTVFVTEVALAGGNHPNYTKAVYDVLDKLERHPEVTVLQTDGNIATWNNLRRIVEAEDMAPENWSANPYRRDISTETVTPELVNQLRDRAFKGSSTESVLDGRILRIPIETAYGVGGAVYIFETVKRVRQERVGNVFRRVPIPPEYTIEVILDQGTAMFAGQDSRVNFNRESTSLKLYRDLDSLIKTANGSPSQQQFRQLAGLWHDLSATSGGWIGGGAGVNHLVIAAAWKKLTGAPMPGLKEPADLTATMKLTRQEFIDHFMEGGLFRNGDQVFRDIERRR